MNTANSGRDGELFQILDWRLQKIRYNIPGSKLCVLNGSSCTSCSKDRPQRILRNQRGTIKSSQKSGMGCQFDIRHATVEGGQSWPQSLRLLSAYINTINIKDFLWEKVNGKWTVINVPLGEGMVDFPKYFALLKQYGVNVPISLHFEYSLGGAEHGEKQITIDKKLVYDAMRKDLVRLRTWLKEAGLN